jgi:TetR/AcrR family transcriptional regulator, tetracycline repressor protein
VKPQRVRTLSRVKIVAAGLGMIDRDGADAITMRRLAQDLGVTPMALYNHFGNKNDLLRAIADHVIEGAEFDGGQTNWQDQLRHCFQTLRNLCLQHPGLPSMLEIEGAAPASVFRPMDVAIPALRAAGLDELSSTRAYFALLGYTLSQATYQARGPYPGLQASSHRSGQIDEWDYDASFEYGLALIIAGIATTAR